MAGDALTISRVEGRQVLGAGWVSHLLQQAVARLLAEPATAALLGEARQAYAERRAALVDTLTEHGVAARGGSGLGVWVPVAEEAPVAGYLLERGWAVSQGERYRFASPPGIRVTTTDLLPDEARRLAVAFAEAMRATEATYAG